MRTIYEIYSLSKNLSDLLKQDNALELAEQLTQGVNGAATSGEALSCIGWVCNNITLNASDFSIPVKDLALSILAEVNTFFKGTQNF